MKTDIHLHLILLSEPKISYSIILHICISGILLLVFQYCMHDLVFGTKTFEAREYCRSDKISILECYNIMGILVLIIYQISVFISHWLYLMYV